MPTRALLFFAAFIALAAVPACSLPTEVSPGTDAAMIDGGRDAAAPVDVGIDAPVTDVGIDAFAPDARVCTPASTRSCYGGADGTIGVGPCMLGIQTCAADGSGFGTCVGSVEPTTESCANGVDDDCDGTVNEADAGCLCVPGASASCYSGPAATVGVGACAAGTHVCAADGVSFGACTGEVTPITESCATSVDDDCDGAVNQGCACTPGEVAPCYSGPAGTVGVGPCAMGTHTCTADGTAYGACTGQVVPVPETCNTPIDDDCNGQVNEGGPGCVCAPNTAQPCYSGAAGTVGVGVCHRGVATCSADGTMLGACVGEVVPVAETCNTAVDDDCNGMTNEGGAGCVCTPNTTASCYSGPAGTSGVGVCHGGSKTCNALGTAYGACMGEVLPAAETCTTPVDDDCNGLVNEGGTGCVCAPGVASACYTGPAGTSGVGICHAGSHTCNSQGTAFGACSGDLTPRAEDCTTSTDDDCDGIVNDGCGTVHYATDVRPIYASHCATCHTTDGSGGANFASSYADSQIASTVCPGHTVGYCTHVRILDGSMPRGAGCSGLPSADSGNAACLSASDETTISAWIASGQLP